MDLNNVITVLVGIGGVIGGILGGRRMGFGSALVTAVNVVDLLQAKVDTLEEDLASRDRQISDLRSRIELLEELVTQRAAVDDVKVEVLGVRGIVDRIAGKVGA